MWLTWFTFGALGKEQRATIHNMASRFLLSAGLIPFSRPLNNPEMWFAEYMVAMNQLGIPPALPNIRWPVPTALKIDEIPEGQFVVGYHPEMNHPFFSWRRQTFSDRMNLQAATDAARRDVIARGLDLSHFNNEVSAP